VIEALEKMKREQRKRYLRLVRRAGRREWQKMEARLGFIA
jgi:hypothetical protein